MRSDLSNRVSPLIFESGNLKLRDQYDTILTKVINLSGLPEAAFPLLKLYFRVFRCPKKKCFEGDITTTESSFLNWTLF